MAENDIGWIGLGKMGRPMSGHLLAAGHSLRVFDTDRGAVAVAEGKGARPVQSIAVLAAESGIVISMIPNDDVLRRVALGEQGVLAHLVPGALYIDMSTVSPEACTEVRAEANRRGAAYLAAPVSGSTATADAASLAIMTSGPEAAFARARPLLERLGRKIFHVGEGAEARYMKLVVNHLVGSTAQLVGEALALGRKGGIAWNTLLEVLGQSVAASPLIAYKLDPLRRRDFAPAFTTVQMIKDMSLVADAMAAQGIPAPLAAEVLALYRQQAEQGFAEEDFFAAVKDIERRAGLGEP